MRIHKRKTCFGDGFTSLEQNTELFFRMIRSSPSSRVWNWHQKLQWSFSWLRSLIKTWLSIKNDVTSICFAVVRWSQCRHLLKWRKISGKAQLRQLPPCPLGCKSLAPSSGQGSSNKENSTRTASKIFHTSDQKWRPGGEWGFEWLAEKKSRNLRDPKLLVSSNF